MPRPADRTYPTTRPHRRAPARPATQDPPAVQLWRAADYRVPCATCGCATNLRPLLRDRCVHCGHRHAPAAQED